MTRLRTGNRRRLRRLQPVAWHKPTPFVHDSYAVEMHPVPHGKSHAQLIREFTDKMAQEIAERMRLPPFFVGSSDTFGLHSGGYLARRLPPLLPVEPRGEAVLPFGTWPILVVPGAPSDEIIVGYPDDPEGAVKITNIGEPKP